MSGINRVKLACPVCKEHLVERDYPTGLPVLADFICNRCIKEGKTAEDIPPPPPDVQETIDWLLGRT